MYNIPEEYRRAAESIPIFWRSDPQDVVDYLQNQVHKGEVDSIGTTAGGRSMWAASYGQPRKGEPTTTFSGSLGCGNVRVYLGPEHEKRVYVALAGVHGSEYEGIVGAVNLISVLETGKDLKGRSWPKIVAAAEQLDRIIVVPIVNVDGRSRVPIRMFPFRGTDSSITQYFNTGGWTDGSNIGWPAVKEFIPLDFSQTQFPGAYPNDAGVNIQHDDFLGNRQPETEALFSLAARERPDLIVNMHTGAPRGNYYMRMLRPFTEPALQPVFVELYRRVHTGLTLEGLQDTDDVALETELKNSVSPFNLDSALNLHSGVLSALIESPHHAFSGTGRKGNTVQHTPEMLVDAQLVAHREAMSFLLENGGRSRWAPGGRAK